MIIESSNLTMGSQRGYAARKSSGGNYTTWGPSGYTKSTFFDVMETKEFQSFGDGQNINSDETKDPENNSMTDESAKKNSSGSLPDGLLLRRTEKLNEMNVKTQMKDIRSQILDYLLRLLLGEDSEEYKRISESNQQAFTVQEYGGNHQYYENYWETESVGFKSTGTVVTSDGREINFNYEVHMSRTFASTYYESHNFGAEYAVMDPLVINTGSSITQVNDQSFYFDLDCDGQLDEISSLAAGSGFLALDKNEDGIINDGSELFGTTSGDGFADLAAYDLDHNGWIDEADEIFQKLKIWYADGGEQPKLISLKEAGIGAIALQNTETPFSLNNTENNTNAYIRKTGIFLYENGGTGTIQHVDLVKKSG
ncbi:MAG: hypothetical protein ACI39H_09740 [Lachnospiraceae bacterium]